MVREAAWRFNGRRRILLHTLDVLGRSMNVSVLPAQSNNSAPINIDELLATARVQQGDSSERHLLPASTLRRLVHRKRPAVIYRHRNPKNLIRSLQQVKTTMMIVHNSYYR